MHYSWAWVPSAPQAPCPWSRSRSGKFGPTTSFEVTGAPPGHYRWRRRGLQNVERMRGVRRLGRRWRTARGGAMSQAGMALRAAAEGCRIVALSLVLALIALLFVASPSALAQADGPPAGSMVMVSNTDGQRLNLRAGPAADQPIVTKLPAGEVLTVTGPGRTAGVTLWVPVKTSAGQPGWVSAEYVVLLTAPTPERAIRRRGAPGVCRPGSRGDGALQPEPAQPGEGRPGRGRGEAEVPGSEGARAGDHGLGDPQRRAGAGRDRDAGVERRRRGRALPRARPDQRRGADAPRRSTCARRRAPSRSRSRRSAPDGGEGRTIVSYFRR